MAQQKSSDSGQQLINLLLIGLGAYLVWEYILSPMLAQQQSASATNCFDVNGNPIACPSGYPAGSVVGSSVSTTTQPVAVAAASNTCYDQNGNAITCPQGYPAGSTVQVSFSGSVRPYIQRTSPLPTSVSNPAADAARTALIQQRAALQSGRGGSQPGKTSIGGIVPSWTASGGPAFNNFIPAGMTFGGGASAFGSPPTKYLQ